MHNGSLSNPTKRFLRSSTFRRTEELTLILIKKTEYEFLSKLIAYTNRETSILRRIGAINYFRQSDFSG